jgi:alpha-beta hydrolase superfamily lysophospholipase
MITMPLYLDDPHWRTIQGFFPRRLQLSQADLPQEEIWDWCGHRIHLDRYPAPEAPTLVVLLHGVGTNGRQMNLILGSRLAQQGYEVLAPDLPGYGMSQIGTGPVRYHDWVELTVDLLARERARQERPVVLFGLSAGGLLALHVAALDQEISGVVATCLLDQRVEQVRLDTAFSPLLARIATPLVQFLARTPLRHLKVPMRLVSKMHCLVNQPDALKAFLSDPTSSGAWVSLAFLDSYVGYQPELEAKDFHICPVLLTQPGEDRWTPISVSQPVVRDLANIDIVKLEGVGHVPLKDPGLQQLEDAVVGFMKQVQPD